MPARPLDGVRVLDLTTLLPGPLATLILAEAGAKVVKIERPGGDDMRHYPPLWGGDGALFALLNRGKTSLVLDLKTEADRDRLLAMLPEFDVLVEQFRPGVMARLGLGRERLHAVNPRLVVCAITGYGQTGPKAQRAGHDLNYMAETGLLGLTDRGDGAPAMPPVLTADIGGGSLPAVLNILLALRLAERTGTGAFLDVAMSDNLFTFAFWAIATRAADGRDPTPGGEIFTGGSPRYQIYRTADDRFLAAAPLEQKFWERFAELIGLPPPLRDDGRDPAATIRAVAGIMASAPSHHWQRLFEGEDVCCSIVATFGEAMAEPHVASRHLFDAEILGPAGRLPALPVPLAPALAAPTGPAPFPSTAAPADD
ncbi:CaiB/BaiF CoA transferase family protein [Acuticoccus mangrovi]|uniref:CoA transferase n=1 Tax=Acuticoccus mangrovi TaxID=2796142 RepID=A0A934ICW2_9HYPH|nr:CaiB/BaiF CoA-transferase family protein [Acuticoccus mangrovi]MBJ3774214.1 CoA transferase [Acuticoccus mangrovi]